VQLFLLKSVADQVSRFDCDLAHVASVMGQLMPPTTIFPSTIVPLRIEPFDCDLAQRHGIIVQPATISP